MESYQMPCDTCGNPTQNFDKEGNNIFNCSNHDAIHKFRIYAKKCNYCGLFFPVSFIVFQQLKNKEKQCPCCDYIDYKKKSNEKFMYFPNDNYPYKYYLPFLEIPYLAYFNYDYQTMTYPKKPHYFENIRNNKFS